MESAKPSRAFVYVDGCNLHNGMRTADLRRFYWLDLAELGTQFLKSGQSLVGTKYFTARVLGNPGKNQRHTAYIDALKSTGRVQVIEGNYQLEPFFCANCHNRRPVPKEKQTDTNIATEIVDDAYTDLWDTAFVVSGDSDLVPPIKKVRERFPHKHVLVAFPPSRVSRELQQNADGSFHVNATMLARSQLPDEIRVGGIVLRRPEKWT